MPYTSAYANTLIYSLHMFHSEGACSAPGIESHDVRPDKCSAERPYPDRSCENAPLDINDLEDEHCEEREEEEEEDCSAEDLLSLVDTALSDPAVVSALNADLKIFYGHSVSCNNLAATVHDAEHSYFSRQKAIKLKRKLISTSTYTSFSAQAHGHASVADFSRNFFSISDNANAAALPTAPPMLKEKGNFGPVSGINKPAAHSLTALDGMSVSRTFPLVDTIDHTNATAIASSLLSLSLLRPPTCPVSPSSPSFTAIVPLPHPLSLPLSPSLSAATSNSIKIVKKRKISLHQT